MSDIDFLVNYSNRYQLALKDRTILKKIIKLKKIFLDIKKNNNKVIIVGNGGSSAIASHVSVDLSKVAKVRSVNFNESDLITCLSNDYGYENWIKKALEFYAKKKDLLILISSSGRSKNLINAANYAKSQNLKIITFTGFEKNNPISKKGDLNFWINSKAYNIVENIHQIWLLMACDLIVGKIEYSAN